MLLPSYTSQSSLHQDYNDALSKIRSFLAGNRSRQTLTECERLLEVASRCAASMQGLAEIEGNPARVTESKQRIERDIGPLSKEVKRQLNNMSQQELFGGASGGADTYEAPNMNDMQGLLTSSDDMLRESLA